MTSLLASEAQLVSGASTEGLSLIVESTTGLVTGIVLAFIFSWKEALIALASSPFIMLGGIINSKISTGMTKGDEIAYKDSNLLAGDAISNYRTVAGLNADLAIVE